MKNRRSLLIISAVLICGIILGLAVTPLFRPGMYRTIDNIVVVRVDDISRELARGQFPVRYSSDLAKGRGYMLFNYYAPLPFYAGASLHKLGINLVGAVKRAYLIAFFIAFIGMFFFAKEYFGPVGGIVSAVFYIFSPYFGYDVYWRGGLGEVWAMSFLPYLFWLTAKSLKASNPLVKAGVALALAAIVLSHNLTTYMIMPFLFIWLCFWWYQTKGNIIRTVITLLLGLSLSAFFWLPAFLEKTNVWVSYDQPSEAYFFQIFKTDWYAMLFPSFIPMQIHWVYIILPLLGMALIIIRNKAIQSKNVVLLASLFAVLGTFLTTDLSKWIWKLFYHGLYLFQYPWRFWIINLFFGSFIAGWIAITLGGKKYVRLVIIALIMIAGIIWYDLPNFRPVDFEFVPEYKAEDPCGTTFGVEYLPVWVTTCIRQIPYVTEEIAGGSGKILSVERGSRSYSLLSEGDERRIRIEKYYYPGWTAEIDNKPVQIRHDNPYGLIEVDVPKGKHLTNLKLINTPLVTFSNVVSLISAAIVIILLFAGLKKLRFNKNTKKKHKKIRSRS